MIIFGEKYWSLEKKCVGVEFSKKLKLRAKMLYEMLKIFSISDAIDIFCEKENNLRCLYVVTC